MNATVASLYRKKTWSLLHTRTKRQLQLRSFLTTVNLNNTKDYYVWEINGKTSNRYATGEVCHYLCGTADKVQWYSAIWSPKNVPRHSFHSLKVVLDRISTGDRLIGWGLQVKYLCLLYNNETETRNHLYMDCSFRFDLWTLVAARCRLPPLKNMSDLLNKMIGQPPTKSSKLLVRLAWSSDIGSRSRETLGFMQILSELSILSSR